MSAKLAELKLPHGLHKWRRLDITHGPPQLNGIHIQLLVRLVHRDLGHALDPVLYGASDVWNNLHSFSKVGTFSLYPRLIPISLE